MCIRDSFKRVGKNNKLFPEHQDAILKLYEDREEVEYETALVSNEDVLDNDSNLSVNSYVAREEVREVIDGKALNEELRQIVARQQVLRDSIDETVADLEGEVDADE
mgnify:CR=1 FL=1